jgi:hypothetical protein
VRSWGKSIERPDPYVSSFRSFRQHGKIYSSAAFDSFDGAARSLQLAMMKNWTTGADQLNGRE